jgi:hypothetical protein
MSGSSEARALEAIIDDDEREAIAALGDYSAGELRTLSRQADNLSSLCWRLAKERS